MTSQGSSDAESRRLELREAITAFHSQLMMLVQSLGIVITADVLLLAYGFTQKLAAILLLASLLPIAMLVMFVETMTVLVPIVYVAIKLERSLSLHEAPFIETYAQSQQGVFPALFHGASSGAGGPTHTVPLPCQNGRILRSPAVIHGHRERPPTRARAR